jgi:hypothetical protein
MFDEDYSLSFKINQINVTFAKKLNFDSWFKTLSLREKPYNTYKRIDVSSSTIPQPEFNSPELGIY